jgi:transcriptional regulator with XRE-family HTH domain
MNFPVATPSQLCAVLRALRRSRALSQAQVGRMLGVNQKRVAMIEKSPSITSFAQISRLVSALGGRLVIELIPPTTPARPATQVKTLKPGRRRKSSARPPARDQTSW